MSYRIPDALIAEENAKLSAAQADDYAALGQRLGRAGVDIEAITAKVAAFAVAVPTWGVGTGGTRFARFPGVGEPRGIFDKIEDCATIHQLTRATPTCSPHFPWDKVSDYRELAEHAAALGVAFDAVNSNTFQDAAGQTLSYKFGSLANSQKAVRDQAIAHNVECIEIGRKLGSKALTVWIADGSNFPGQSNLNRVFDWYLESMTEIYARLPQDWRVFIEHKLYEPAFYSTVISDWGTSLMAAQALGPKAYCLVDLGHHAPNVNIEQVVARLIRVQRLAGFHFNDSKYGDDDLDAGAIDPFRLFLVFNELVDASHRHAPGFDPAYMLDQSHNVTDPIESLMASAMETAARLCASPYCQPGRARRGASGQRRDARPPYSEGGLSRRRVADSGRSARAQRRRDRSDRRLSGVELSPCQSEGTPSGRRVVVGDCLTQIPFPGPPSLLAARQSTEIPATPPAPREFRGTHFPAPQRTERSFRNSSFRLFRRRRRHRFDRNRHRLRLAPEAPPRHPHIAEQSHPRVRLFEVRRELAVLLHRNPIVLPPGLEHRVEFVGLLGSHRHSGAAAKRVDRNPPLPVELEAMAAWHMMEPAMSVFEIGRLEPKRRNHWGHVQIANRVP